MVGRVQSHQTRFNASSSNCIHQRLEIEFEKLGWEKKPLLSQKPRLIDDFRKNLFFLNREINYNKYSLTKNKTNNANVNEIKYL